MNAKRNAHRTDAPRRRTLPLSVCLVAAAVIIVYLGTQLFIAKRQEERRSELPTHQVAVMPAPEPDASAGAVAMQKEGDGRWDGPILYYRQGSSLPALHLILIEKDRQELSLYRYDGNYTRVKTYRCVTGKKRGDKEKENDDKTPEGIYFNTKTYRDRKITIFGDRAFGLSYPDAFDDLDGRGGSGIFVHGSNRDVNPYSTNGCLVLDNLDLADLDKRIRFDATPVIIGKTLPYRFSGSGRDLSEIIPVIKKAMIPKDFTGDDIVFDQVMVLGYQDQMVAVGRIHVDAPTSVDGYTRVYLADPGEGLLVLVKREWSQEKRLVAKAKPKPKPTPKPKPAIDKDKQIVALVDAWRIAWQKERLDDYISHYHPGFANKGRSLAEWKQYKGRLNQRYRRISVDISDLKVKMGSGRASAYFKQRYRTESYEADGYKRLTFRKKGRAWKIFREDSYPTKPSDWPS